MRAFVGVGFVTLNISAITGSLLLLLVKIVGIIFTAMISFLLVNLYEKWGMVEFAIKGEVERREEENAGIE